jgi:hypothetical protein
LIAITPIHADWVYNAPSRRSHMAKAKQLTVSCENRPGALAQLTKCWATRKVNTFAFLTTTSGTEGPVQLVVDTRRRRRRPWRVPRSRTRRPTFCTLNSPTCLELWRVSPASWPPRRSTSPPATPPPRRAPRRPAWRWGSRIWRKPLAGGSRSPQGGYDKRRKHTRGCRTLAPIQATVSRQTT